MEKHMGGHERIHVERRNTGEMGREKHMGLQLCAVFSHDFIGWSIGCFLNTVSDHLESLSTSVIEILTAGRLNGQCSGLYG